jgi:hypothetical protein
MESIGRVLSSIVGRVAGWRAQEFHLLKQIERMLRAEETTHPGPPELRDGRANREGFAKKKTVAVRQASGKIRARLKRVR